MMGTVILRVGCEEEKNQQLKGIDPCIGLGCRSWEANQNKLLFAGVGLEGSIAVFCFPRESCIFKVAV